MLSLQFLQFPVSSLADILYYSPLLLLCIIMHLRVPYKLHQACTWQPPLPHISLPSCHECLAWRSLPCAILKIPARVLALHHPALDAWDDITKPAPAEDVT
jgi:hypothetical protein